MKTLILDGYNLFYRARFSGIKDGETTTVFNFFRGLRLLVENLNCDEIFLVLEGYPKKRKEQFVEYKAQRIYDNSDNFKEQRKKIVSLLHQYFPIQIVKHADYECDDIVAFLARTHEAKGNDVVVVSTDTDFIQLITDKIQLYNPIKKEFLPKPDYDYVQWKALTGDSADNIDGFSGIGAKRAEAMCKDNTKLTSFLNENNNRDKFNLNLDLIRFHSLPDDDISTIEYYSVTPKSNWDQLNKDFIDLKFYSLTNKTAWPKFTNTFQKYFKEVV